MATTLQASLICRPPSLSRFTSSASKRLQLPFSPDLPSNVTFNYNSDGFCSLCRLISHNHNPISLKSQIFRRNGFVIACTLHPDGVNSIPSHKSNLNSDAEKQELGNEFSDEISSGDVSRADPVSEESLKKTENANAGDEVAGEVKSAEEVKRRLPIVVFLLGLFATARQGFEKLMASNWFSWWPFWRQEKRLERLISEADANPKDAAKQSALLAELNKHRWQETQLVLLNLMRFCLIY